MRGLCQEYNEPCLILDSLWLAVNMSGTLATVDPVPSLQPLSSGQISTKSEFFV